MPSAGWRNSFMHRTCFSRRCSRGLKWHSGIAPHSGTNRRTNASVASAGDRIAKKRTSEVVRVEGVAPDSIVSGTPGVLRISPDACYRSGLGERIIGVSISRGLDDLDLQTFRDSLAEPQPSVGLSPALQALWWDGKGDWNKAHERAQEHENRAGMHVHAYLHRKEGDQSNAEYWYRRCDIVPSTLTVDEEWEELARSLLKQG